MRPAVAPAAIALALAVACGGGGPTATSGATAVIVLTNDHGDREELTVELARTAEERGRGLMLRDELAADRGMLFVFPQETTSGFWMKDTSIPLSIAFITADGTILDVQEMEPFSEELHRAPVPYRYALEVNQGWFRERGFGAGGRVELPGGVRQTG